MIEGRQEILRYEHRAMATVFELLLVGEDPAFAGGAARAVFEEIDRLEQDLSRYVSNSDITRINNLQPGQSVRVGHDTFQCLRLSLEYWEETRGAFDATMGALMDCWVGKDRSLLHPLAEEIVRASARRGMDRLTLDEAAMTVGVHGRAPLVDLGAIGKGYAVDRAVELLKEWGVGSALLHGGTSSAYAFGDYPGHHGWPVTLSHPVHATSILEKVHLKDEGLGGSGIKKRRHIIDPRRSSPVGGRTAAWVVSESATRSDAFSTAFMIMTHEEIEDLIVRYPHLRAIIAENDPDSVVRFGRAGAV